MILILLGAPGSGKGTQAKRVSDVYGIPHISTGDIFRKNIMTGTQLGIKAKEYIDKGLLVPDEVTNGIVKDRIGEDDCKNGFVLDGYPRTTDQAKRLKLMLENKGIHADVALNISVPDITVIQRLSGRRMCKCGEIYHIEYNPPDEYGVCDKCGQHLFIRKDDEPETIRKRLKEYHEKTKPIIDYYNKEGILINIDGMPLPDIVNQSVMEVLGKYK